MWTRFMDMRSGGSYREKWHKILIEAPKDEAKVIFYSRFDHYPGDSCMFCNGEVYSISEEESLAQITAFDRGCEYAYFRPDGTECPKGEAWEPAKGKIKGYSSRYVERPCGDRWRPYIPLDEYLSKDTVLVIYAEH